MKTYFLRLSYECRCCGERFSELKEYRETAKMSALDFTPSGNAKAYAFKRHECTEGMHGIGEIISVDDYQKPKPI